MDYRVYLLDGANRIVQAHDLVSDSDEAAIDLARSYMNSHAVELWQRARMVGRLEPEDQ